LNDVDPVRYYWLESYLFTEVHRRFHAEQSLDAFDLFSIVIWKANRAKSRVAHRLLERYGDLERAARELSAALSRASLEQERFEILIHAGFQLAMASAILTVLWPDVFTVYDVRVCQELGDELDRVKNWKGHRLWEGYCRYRDAVNCAVTGSLSLRDKDRFLWGRSAMQQLKRNLQSGFADSRMRK
jgi:hypothetical protein